MRYFLSIFVERFGKFSSCRDNLLELDSLDDLDFCTKSFSNAKELRTFFEDKVKKFKEKFASQFDYWHFLHPGKTNDGKIYANFIVNVNRKNYIATIPILYKDDELIPFNEAIEHIVHYLDIDANFKRFIEEKPYLLLEDDDELEFLLAKGYLKEGDIVTKRELINHFVNRLSKLDDEKKYMYLRCLTNMCHLLRHEVYTDKGDISLFSKKMPKEGKLVKSKHKHIRVESNSDSLFERIISEENVEELYKYYDLEKIEKEGRKHV